MNTRESTATDAGLRAPRADLQVELVDGEAVILDKESGKVHQLNATATLVWGGIADGNSPSQIAASLSEEFDIQREIAERDVQQVIEQFEELKLFQQ